VRATRLCVKSDGGWGSGVFNRMALGCPAAKPSRSNRSGNVVIGFSSGLQINPVPFCIGRDVRHGRSARNCLFAFPKTQSADVNDRKHDNCDDRPKHHFHCTLHHRGANGRFPAAPIIVKQIAAKQLANRTKPLIRVVYWRRAGRAGFRELTILGRL